MINSPILDTCCGGKMFYFDKHDKRVSVYIYESAGESASCSLLKYFVKSSS